MAVKTADAMERLIVKILSKEMPNFGLEQDFEIEVPLTDLRILQLQRADSIVRISEKRPLSASPRNLPAQEFEIGEDSRWYPLSLTLALEGKREAIIYCEGKRWVDVDETDYQIAFARDWASDLARMIELR